MRERVCSRALPLSFASSASRARGNVGYTLGDPIFEHVIHGAGDLVRGGHEGLCGTKSSFHAPIEGAQRTVRAADRLRGHAEGLRGTVAILDRAALEDLAAGDVIFGSQAQPGAEVFVIGPRAHVGADLCEDGLRQGIAHAMHRHEVHTGDA